MNTWHIQIKGQVQGVGFRPFVFTLAKKMEIKGWVNNTKDGVHIVFNAEKKLAFEFKNDLFTKAPRLSKITSIHIRVIQEEFFDNFQIVHSETNGEPNLLLTPDFALCEDCRLEIHNPNNRRQSYAFTTCTNCGPRFSIIDRLPYDREFTTMEEFRMCPSCSSEYDDPLDRRYYSQTNSCIECGIALSLFDSNKRGVVGESGDLINQVVAWWEAGKIVAIKGIGGYLLTADASNKTTVLELRKRKHRPSKPFALMYPKLSALNDFLVRKEERLQLQSAAAPIVLLEKSDNANILNEIAPHLNQVGLMLPYTPLYELLLKKFNKPIIATSGNISNSPIIYQDEEVLDNLAAIADYTLSNNRKIVVPQDDSVLKFSFFKKQKIILRRSRGLAPTYINPKLTFTTQSVLAMGAMLKGTFTLLQKGNIYISQYLGSLAHFDAQQSYQHTIQHFLNLLDTQPQVILCDKHPEYPSTHLGNQLSKEWNVPIKKVQHHLAHFGAILGEHSLIHSKMPILGIIWDGTGWGDDGQIWGGEFFKYEQYDFVRCHHFEYFNFMLGDKMPREPRISALSACWGIDESATFLKEKFTKTEWQIYHRLLQKGASLQTSSIGRIFDAVASLLGLMDKQTYEGEAAMQLEALATNYCKEHGLHFTTHYLDSVPITKSFPTKKLMAGILADLKRGEAKGFIAAKFHFSLVLLIKKVAQNQQIKHIAFSGGVFQNSLLIDLIKEHLEASFELYFHQELAANDENISFGQLVYYQIAHCKESLDII